MAVIAFYQRQIAEERHKIALSRQLGAQALNRADGALDLALLLSQEAFNIRPTVEARGSLLNGLQFSPHLEAFLHGHIDTVYSVAFSPDGTLLATGGGDNQIKWFQGKQTTYNRYFSTETILIINGSNQSDSE